MNTKKSAEEKPVITNTEIQPVESVSDVTAVNIQQSQDSALHVEFRQN